LRDGRIGNWFMSSETAGSIAMEITTRFCHLILLIVLAPSLLPPSQALASLLPFSPTSLTQPNLISSEARTPQLPSSSSQATVTLQPSNPLDTNKLSVQTDFAVEPSRTVEVISSTISPIGSASSVPAPVSMATAMFWTTPQPSSMGTHSPSSFFLSTSSDHASSPPLTHMPQPTTPLPSPSSTHLSSIPSPILMPTTSARVSLPPPIASFSPTTTTHSGVSAHGMLDLCQEV